VFVKGVKEYAEKLLSHIPELDPDIEVVNEMPPAPVGKLSFF
jgi:hypothetical protein